MMTKEIQKKEYFGHWLLLEQNYQRKVFKKVFPSAKMVFFNLIFLLWALMKMP